MRIFKDKLTGFPSNNKYTRTELEDMVAPSLINPRFYLPRKEECATEHLYVTEEIKNKK